MSAEAEKDLRSQVLAAAAQLFVQRGYHGLSMREIAAAVGVSKAALYYHFQDKEQLFLDILDGYLAHIEALIDRVLNEEKTSSRQVQKLVEGILTQPSEQRAVIRLASQEMAWLSDPARQAFQRAYQDRFIRKIEAILRNGIERGEFRPIDPLVATWTLLGMMYPYLYPSLEGDIPLAEAVLNQVVSIFLDGVKIA